MPAVVPAAPNRRVRPNRLSSVLSLFVISLSILLSLLFYSGNASAERELIVPFHEGGHLVLDQLSGLRVNLANGVSYAGPAGIAFRTTKSDALLPGGPASETSTTSVWFAPSADIFVTDHLSVGGLVEVGHTWGAVESGALRLELPGTTSMTFLPRVGGYIAFTDRIGLWPRLGVGWTSTESVSFVSTGGNPTRETFRAMVLDVDLSLVYRFGETFFMRAGPELGLTIGGRRTEESNGASAGAGGSVLQFSGVVGFGMNIEL